jgi:hypothetical protein
MNGKPEASFRKAMSKTKTLPLAVECARVDLQDKSGLLKAGGVSQNPPHVLVLQRLQADSSAYFDRFISTSQSLPDPLRKGCKLHFRPRAQDRDAFDHIAKLAKIPKPGMLNQGFVEEQRPALGGSDLAGTVAESSGESLPDMAEQFASQKLVARIWTAHGDERPVGPLTPGVNGASERLLAGSFLASDQEGRVGRSRDAGLGHRAPDLRVGAFHLTLGIFGSHATLEVSDLIAWPAVADQTLDDGRDLIGSDSSRAHHRTTHARAPRPPTRCLGSRSWRPLRVAAGLATGSNGASESLGKAFSGDGQQTLPLESLPQPPLPAPFTLGGKPTSFQEVATDAQTPNAALHVSEQ